MKYKLKIKAKFFYFKKEYIAASVTVIKPIKKPTPAFTLSPAFQN